MPPRTLPIYSLLRRAPTLLMAAAVLAACRGPRGPEPRAADGPGMHQVAAEDTTVVREANVRAALTALAHDSMLGRATASEGMHRSARYIAARLRELGVQPAGDSLTYLQRVPLALMPRPDGRRVPVLVGSWQVRDTFPTERRALGLNVVGILPGSDTSLRQQAVVIGAHYDHLGMGRAVGDDTIFNGADDDASGVVAVLEIARALARGPAPKRTIVFLLTTGEEVGLLGTRWYLQHPTVPLDRTVMDLQIEMIGRPDPLAGGPGKAWLTGYERSTMGDMLAAAGVPIVADPRPAQNFFERSDNIAFARLGIPAHTLSSFGLHTDYHTVDDEVERVDFAHMTAVVRAAVRAARLLADGPLAVWKPGGRPAASPGS